MLQLPIFTVTKLDSIKFVVLMTSSALMISHRMLSHSSRSFSSFFIAAGCYLKPLSTKVSMALLATSQLSANQISSQLTLKLSIGYFYEIKPTLRKIFAIAFKTRDTISRSNPEIWLSHAPLCALTSY